MLGEGGGTLVECGGGAGGVEDAMEGEGRGCQKGEGEECAHGLGGVLRNVDG